MQDGGGAGGTPSRLGHERRARHALDADWAGKRFLVTAHAHLLWLAAEIAVTCPAANGSYRARQRRLRGLAEGEACLCACVSVAALPQQPPADSGGWGRSSRCS